MSFCCRVPLAAFVCFLGCVCNATLLSADQRVEIDQFERTVLATGLVQPMELDLAPDGRVFLIELAGTIKVIDPKTQQQTVVGAIDVTTAQENGLIGLALDPHFAENGWLYLQYSPPDFSGQQISRFTFVDGKVNLASEKPLLRYEEQRRECCHHAGSLEFGPNGDLYIGTGDNTNPFNDSEGYAPLDERDGRSPWDAQRSAGNTNSYNGKILRIHPEPDGSYSIPDGNLFPRDGSIGRPEIYVMGCRNPWRINIDQRTGFLYWGDVGPDAGQDGPRGPRGYDEINQARSAGNFGWPYFIGDNFAYSMVDFESGQIGPPQKADVPVNRSVNNTGAEQLPPARGAMVYYPGGSSAEFPEVGSGGRTACAGPVFYHDAESSSPNGFPAAYNRTLFAYEWSRNAIYAVRLDADSNLERLERFLPDMTFVRPIDLQFDRGGSLYVIEYGETWGVNPDARLIRLDYVRGNRAPIASATASNDVGREPLTVQFSADESLDKDGDPLRYRWISVASGDPNSQSEVIADSPNPSVRFEHPGVYTITLEVRDPSGTVGVSTLPVIVGNARPQVAFVQPADGDFFSPGQTVRYRAVVRDLEDGTSDIEQADADGWHFIDSEAPTRLFVEAIPMAVDGETGQAESPGWNLIRNSDCLNCHAINRPLIGPSFVQIANKYREDPHQIEQSVARVLNGSTGVWGKVGMLPHVQHTPAEVRAMVEHVYSVTADASNPNARGFTNTMSIDRDAAKVRLEAVYSDLGRGKIPSLMGVGSVTLRNRHVQAEAADEFRGTSPLGSDRAEAKQFMGAIEHDGFLRFDQIPLDQTRTIALRVASAGAGGDIEVHRSSADGPLLGRVTVEVNGDWEAFYETTIPLRESQGRDDLYLVFKNERNRGGLMNVDAITFLP
ncbi:carbohydrate-binding protein [Roseiconus nitratireducens]|uniref:Carbohydrate-binding protein n=1 Tax=Roseiconus nitratireducens TaxID=2605748 RepID=A0A5M6DA03_9BACT|nr:PQQ-dependent sugar dehydrogenase [Roseiconus nitratireducens]KAA5544371.1 carbohydrate-binding protein [Roseiconus nitratireducens]